MPPRAGAYQFEAPAGTWSLTVAASSLAGVLAGLTPTNTPCTSVSLTTSNALECDFGFDGSSIGDRVWSDGNGDGVQDGGETGINGVTVRLRNSGGTVVATGTTQGDGGYTFTDVIAGTYAVEVDSSTLAAGVTQTFDLDGLGTPHTAGVTAVAGQTRTDADFGYEPAPVPDMVVVKTNNIGGQTTLASPDWRRRVSQLAAVPP